MNPWKRKEVIGNATLYLGDCLEILGICCFAYPTDLVNYCGSLVGSVPLFDSGPVKAKAAKKK